MSPSRHRAVPARAEDLLAPPQRPSADLVLPSDPSRPPEIDLTGGARLHQPVPGPRSAADVDRCSRDDLDVELERGELAALAAEVIEANGRGDTPFGSYFLPADHRSALLARHVERKVFAEAFDLDRHAIAAEYDPYDPATLFLCVLDHRRLVPAGTMRLVLPGLGRTKSVDEIARSWHQPVDEVLQRTGIALDLDRTWDIATLMVDSEYRTGLVSHALHQAASTTSARWGIRWYVTVLDVAVLRLLQVQLRRPFSHYRGVEPIDYEGSLSVPVYSDAVEYQTRLRAERPELYETIYQGRNLEAAVSHPDWEESVELVEDVVAGARRAGRREPAGHAARPARAA
jgi:hypothetical protein